MTSTATTYAEAEKIAAEYRAVFAGCDWTVRIIRPLFRGDHYTVVVS